MNQAAESVTEMYRLSGQAFEDRFRIKATNLRRMILEQVVHAPFSDIHEHLATLGRTLVVAQMHLVADARLTPDQSADLESRLDSVAAEAIVTIERCLEGHPDRWSSEFQFEAARRLGIPLV